MSSQIGVFNTSGDIFCVLAGMEEFGQKNIEIHFVSLQAWEKFIQHMLRFILCPFWHGEVWIIRVEMDLVSLLNRC